MPIAAFAAKRLDLTASGLPLVGRGWPTHLLLLLLSVGLLGVGAAAALERRLTGGFRPRRGAGSAGAGAGTPEKREDEAGRL